MKRAIHVIAAGMLLSGCPRGGGGDEDTFDTGEDPRVDITCPDGTPQLGQAGQFTVETDTFVWEWDNALGLYVGPPQYRIVPDDVVSYSVVLDDDERETAMLYYDDAVRRWVNDDWYENDLAHGLAVASTITFPISENSAPRSGCVSFIPGSLEEVEGQTSRIHYVTRRTQVSDPVLDLNVVVVDGTTLFQEELDAALDVMDALYTGGGAPGLGRIQTFTLDSPVGDILDGDSTELGDLLASVSDTEAQAINVFFISDFIDGGTLGIAAGIPGPNGVAGTYGSGVIVAVDPHLFGDGETLDTDLMGETMAHEIGHQLGLFHTSEAEGGSHDLIADTPECPTSNDGDRDGFVYADECAGVGGENFMFWTGGDVRQDQMSPGQAAVLFNTPVAR